MTRLAEMMNRHAASGRLEWIGTRPYRGAEMTIHEQIAIDENGLPGDRATGRGKRAVTLIQAEHLPVIAALCRYPDLKPEMLRRNLVISGINLLALRQAKFMIGTAILEASGICAPCSKMEDQFGTGGFNAMRGHGGITAIVIKPGVIRLGDELIPLTDAYP